MFFLAFPENGLNFVAQKLQKTENVPFETLRTFIFDLKVASKPFSKKFPMTNLIGFEGSVSFSQKTVSTSSLKNL